VKAFELNARAELRSSQQQVFGTAAAAPAIVDKDSDVESDDVVDNGDGQAQAQQQAAAAGVPVSAGSSQSDCPSINQMLQRNRVWRESVTKSDPTFFERLSVRQMPEFLAIGCSDSRVSLELLTGVGVGELFVHRNIANMVISTDMSCLSVIQYAVEVLKVRSLAWFIFFRLFRFFVLTSRSPFSVSITAPHLITQLQVRHVVVIGHRECGGVRASLDAKPLGVIDNWLRNIQDVYRLHQEELDALHGEARVNRLVELNVIEQVLNVYKNGFVQKARALNGGWPHIHGLVYDMRTGTLEQLGVDVAKIFEATSHVFSYERGTLTRTLSN
jgi:carbonic anhydrase